MLACVRLLLLSKPKQRLRFGKRGRGGGKHCRSADNHPEKQTTIAKLIQSRQADIQHPLVYRRTYAPFASAPCAPGVQGQSPAALFPRFLSRQRNRAAGGNPPAGVNAARVTPHQALRASCLAAARSGAALTCHRHVIHSRAPASQPQGKLGYWSSLRQVILFCSPFPIPRLRKGGSNGGNRCAGSPLAVGEGFLRGPPEAAERFQGGYTHRLHNRRKMDFRRSGWQRICAFPARAG